MQHLPVFVVMPQRLLLLDVAGPIEVLRRGNIEQDQVQFDVIFVAAEEQVTTSVGLQLAHLNPLPANLPSKAMIVLVGSVDSVLGSSEQPEGDPDEDGVLVNWLRTSVRPEHCLVTICSGALLAGRAGLLDGRACTTHHHDCDLLQEMVPSAEVKRNHLYVQDGNVYSSAGVTAGIDLMLHLLEQLTGHDCAVRVARYLVVYLRRAGADPQLSPWIQERDHIHPAVIRVQDAIRRDPTRAWTRPELAKLAGSSGRHLSRLFQQHTGMIMAEYRNRICVALARELLSKSQLDMELVAERSGFESARQLRRAWGKVYETPPGQVRIARGTSSDFLPCLQ